MPTLCPTCHSNIGSGSLNTADRRQGVQGMDTNGLPVPHWSDDPVLTALGLNGIAYRGVDYPKTFHVAELQERLNAVETDLGLALTTFSPVNHDTHVSRRHIVELRESIEKVLNAADSTLEEYFKFDDEGNEVAQNPLLVKYGANVPQNEWVDVDRGAPYQNINGTATTQFVLPSGGSQLSPTLPRATHIRAIHIEDLRHPLSVLGIPVILVDLYDDKYFAKKTGPVKFIKAEACSGNLNP